MKKIKILLFICCLISTIELNATNTFTLKQTNNSYKESISVGKVFKEDTQLSLLHDFKQIIGFSINGTLRKKNSDYYARILLCDNNGNEYLVLESYEEINNEDVLLLSDYCEETILLDNIQPTSLKIMVHGAELRIDNVTFLLPKEGYLLRGSSYKKEWNSRRRTQVEQIVEKINLYNFKNRKLWGADVTKISMLPWNEKKKILGLAENSIDGRGLEYYARGIFEFERNQNRDESETSNQSLRNTGFPLSFDWRNRHGRNWMTSVKDQYPGNGCWAFAAVGVTEAIATLYFNRDLPFSDLSEQEVISCSDCGTNADGGYTDDALQWIADNGISEEKAFRFVNADVPCSNKNSVYEELISFKDAVEVPIGQDKEEFVKKYLIQKGPLLSGYLGNPGHAMPLVGFKTIQAGDKIQIFGEELSYTIQKNDYRIGRTYWIYKDSYAMRYSHEFGGYAYIYFGNLSNMLSPYYAETPVYSNTLTEEDIVYEDADGDGYYNWGIGPKPAKCPYWVPDTPDGDDSNINLGKIDPLGNIANLYPSGITIKTSTTYDTNTNLSGRIGIVKDGVLIISSTVNQSGSGRIRVCEGGALIVDGGALLNANITMIPGSTLILKNNGRISMAPGLSFYAPKGVVVKIESGEII